MSRGAVALNRNSKAGRNCVKRCYILPNSTHIGVVFEYDGVNNGYYP